MPKRSQEELLSHLNPPQREAVTYERGPLLVLAGAGSGKTRVLTYRIVYLVGKLKVRPSNILAVTFTNKAAEEMKSRVFQMIGKGIQDLWIGTFHSMCARILRREGEAMGISKNFTIYDDHDELSLLEKILKEEKISERVISPKYLRGTISGAKNSLIPPEEYPLEEPRSDLIIHLYSLYQKRLRESNSLDFDDLLMKAVELFQGFPEIRMRYAERFEHILVDEYQDTNHAQYRFILLLSSVHRNLCVVGDEDQSIYRFRGADIRNILHFEKDFPDAKIIRLEENYRSTQAILDAASAVVANNQYRIGKTLWTKRKEGRALSLLEAFDEEDEARRVLEIIRKRRGTALPCPLRDFVILYRINAQSRALEEALRRRGVPYVIVGGMRFYERKEIKDLLAYLKVFSNPSDFMSLSRILNVPKRGIGEKTIEILWRHGNLHSLSLYATLGRVEEMEELSPRVMETLKDFYEMCEGFRKLMKKVTVYKLLSQLERRIGYLEGLEREGTLEAMERVENVKELLTGAKAFEKRSPDPFLEAFLNEVSLFTDIDRWDETKDAVTLMTAHNAKGLEFPTVIITGLEEGLFPHSFSYDSLEELEEERRLFYVALTRAKEEVFLTYARGRQRYGSNSFGRPSRFLSEIPSPLLSGDVTGLIRRVSSSSFED